MLQPTQTFAFPAYTETIDFMDPAGIQLFHLSESAPTALAAGILLFDIASNHPQSPLGRVPPPSPQSLIPCASRAGESGVLYLSHTPLGTNTAQSETCSRCGGKPMGVRFETCRTR